MLFDYKKNSGWMENLTIVMQLGLTMVGCILFCFFLGRYIDKWLGTKGIFVTLFILLGVAGGGNVAYRQILEITADKDSQKDHSPKGPDDQPSEKHPDEPQDGSD